MRRSILRIALVLGTTTTVMLGGGGGVGGEREAAAQPAPACTTPKTICAGEGGYYASAEDLNRVTAVSDPLLKELRTCLDTAGGKHIIPAFVIRWDSDGNAVSVKIDVPGYESQACVAKVQAKLQTLQNPRETAIRCEYSCAKPATPPPVTNTPPPVVVPAPAPTKAPPPTTTTTPPAVTPKPKEADWHTEKVWYGWQGLIVDAGSLILMGVGVGAKSGGIGWPGYFTFLLGTPIVHWAHGNIGPGFGSVAMRFLIPPTTMAIGLLTGLIVGANSRNSGASDAIVNAETGAAQGAIAGFAIGALGCIAIDAFALAYTKERVEGPLAPLPAAARNESERLRPSRPWFTLAPTFNVQKNQTSIGFAGQF